MSCRLLLDAVVRALGNPSLNNNSNLVYISISLVFIHITFLVRSVRDFKILKISKSYSLLNFHSKCDFISKFFNSLGSFFIFQTLWSFRLNFNYFKSSLNTSKSLSLVHTFQSKWNFNLSKSLFTFESVLLVMVCCGPSPAAGQLTMPEELRNYTHLVTMITLRPKLRPRTTMKPMNASPGDSAHMDYMFKKYERDFGSQLDEDFTEPSLQPGQTTPTPRVITITEMVDEDLEMTDCPQHHILQLMNGLGNKGLRVYAKLKEINEQQNEEHFPWKYMTLHPAYRDAATTPPSSPATFENEEARQAFKNRSEKAAMRELFYELKDCLQIGEEKKKELLKERTPSSAEDKQMREHYEQTKDMVEPFDYTTWDGGEGHIKMTPPSNERETASGERIKRYDTLEVYHEHKAQEDKEMCDEYGEHWDKDTKERSPGCTRRTMTTKTTTTKTTESVNLNGKITIPWDAMSSIMWHYVNRVTFLNDHNVKNNATTARGESTTNKMLEDYLKYLSSIGQTIEPPTTNYRVERFPTRKSSAEEREEERKRDLYSKGAHFKEKFTKRIDSMEMEKRRSRLSTTPTTPSTTPTPITFRRVTYDSHQKEGMDEFFKLNKIPTDSDFYVTSTQKSFSNIMWHYVNQVTMPKYNSSPVITTISTIIQQKTQPKKVAFTESLHKKIQSSTTLQVQDSREEKVDSKKYNNIDIPNIHNVQTTQRADKETSNTEMKATRTMSYKELSSVVSYYAELLRINKDKTLYFEATDPLVTSALPTTATSTLTTSTYTTPPDAYGMTEAPLQHVYNILFDPFRHDAITEAHSSPVQNMDDNYNQFLRSIGSSFQTEPYLNTTDPMPGNQLRHPMPPTTPKVYSKADVYAMGHRTYRHRYHDPFWRSKYPPGVDSTTIGGNPKLLNIFDDPLGVYMKQDTEEQKEEARKEKKEKLATLVNSTFYPYWRDLNKKYFNSTVSVFPGQLTPRDENGTTTLFDYKIFSSEETAAKRTTLNVTEANYPQEIKSPEQVNTPEVIPEYSDEHYIERRPTTTALAWRGYELETPDPAEAYPSAQELARRLRDGESLNPEEMLDKRLAARENEEEEDQEGEDMPSVGYMNLTDSEQLCRDREPELRFFDNSKAFSSEGFETMEGWSNETYNHMEEVINQQAEELKAKFKERQLNKTREAEERRKTTKPDSDEVQGFKMGNINFKHLENDWQAKHEMKEFKDKLKNQFDAIYERTTEPSTLKTETTEHILMVTNKNGTVIRRLKKIKVKRRKLVTIEEEEFLKLNFSIDYTPVTEPQKRKRRTSEEQFRAGIMKRSLTDNPLADANQFIVVTNQQGKVIRNLKRRKIERTTNPDYYVHTSNSPIPKDEFTTLTDETEGMFVPNDRETDESTLRMTTGYSGLTSWSREIFKSVDKDAKQNLVSNNRQNLVSVASRRIEKFQQRQFSLPRETNFFTFEPTKDPKHMNSLERKFHRGEAIDVDDNPENVNPELEKFIADFAGNLTSESNMTLTEEEREIDRVSEKYFKEKYAGDIEGYERDYEGNLVPTLSPMEYKKEVDAMEREKIELMRKARGEFDRFMSAETYNQLKDQREVRMKHLDEYAEWQYKEEHELEQERRRRKGLTTTEATACVERAFIADNVTPEATMADNMTTCNTLRPRIVERFKERPFSLPFETTEIERSAQCMAARELFTLTLSTTERTTASTRKRMIERFQQRQFSLAFEKPVVYTQETIGTFSPSMTLEQTFSTTSDRPSTWITVGHKTVSSTHQSTLTKTTGIGNTLVDQLLHYKRFNQIKKKPKPRYTISHQNYTKPTTQATNATDYPDYGDYNISTTPNLIHGVQHEDPLEHLTNVPAKVFDAMKINEEDLYQRYHNNEINFDKFLELKNRLISRYIGYAKRTTVYTHPTFNITSTVFPTLGEIENYEDVKREWKKAEEFERKMFTSNDSFLQSAFSIAFTPFPPTIPPHPRRRYKRMAKYPPYTRQKERPILKNSSLTFYTIEAKRRNKGTKTRNQRKQCTTHSEAPQISSPKYKHRQTKAYDSKKEINSIKKQLLLLREDVDNLKLSIGKVTMTEISREADINENEYFLNPGTVYSMQLTNENLTTIRASDLPYERKPYVYAREEKTGVVQKFEMELKEVSFEDTVEKDQIQQKFVDKDKQEAGAEDDTQKLLFMWRTVTPREEEDGQDQNVSDKNETTVDQTEDYKDELSTVHPHTLVTMVSDLYHQRISLQNHIKYETTTPKIDNRTFLYELFGFNSRTPRPVTRNVSAQFSLYQRFRSTLQRNYRRVSQVQHILGSYTKNKTIFSKRQQRLWDVFFYEKNIPTARHPHGQARMHVGFAPVDNRVLKPKFVEYEYDYDYYYSSDHKACCCHKASNDSDNKSDSSESLRQEQREFNRFIAERKCIRTLRPLRFVWQMKSSLPFPWTEKEVTLMNPDPMVTGHFFFEQCEPP